MTVEFILGTSWVFLGNLHNPLSLSFLNCKVRIITPHIFEKDEIKCLKRMKLCLPQLSVYYSHKSFHSYYYYKIALRFSNSLAWWFSVNVSIPEWGYISSRIVNHSHAVHFQCKHSIKESMFIYYRELTYKC